MSWLVVALLGLLSGSPPAVADDVPVKLKIENGKSGVPATLVGNDARLQLIVSADFGNGDLRDWTDRVTYSAQPAGRVRIEDALVTPIANGTVQVVARDDAGHLATAEIEVSGIDEHVSTSFPSQVVPIFTKLGCNGGGCHGKVSGQNGFKLSLLGFEPRDDYEHLVKESRGRRVSPATADQSLLLLKAINASPHGGGQRLKKDSHEYRLLRRWIAQGLPYGNGNEPKVTSIDVFPSQRRLQPGTGQQLSVVASYSDGTTEDVTRAAVYESNDTGMAEVSSTGLVQLGQLVGDVAVMARYQGHVTVFRADIPLPGANDAWKSQSAPQPRNLVDQYVFEKLRSLGIPPSPPCDDATFLRRTTLDIVGRLPTLEETEAFLADPSENKRDTLIERL
ncbi:MAG: Ig-like domain-containing protein, partial [Pirellulales bacterium]|nr:Ig-like domain-containing protein [Pirellulales bacterium]